MQKRITVPALTASLFAAAFALHPSWVFAASDCVDEPDPAAQGHWYYHVDRATGRKCWHLTEANPTAMPPQAAPASVPTQPAPAQPAPDPARQQPFASFFSSLTSGFTTAGVSPAQPVTANRDPRGAAAAVPDPTRGDEAAAKRRQRADVKPAPVPKPDRQASARSAPADQPRSASLSQAERDALFQEYLQWKERQ